MTQKDTHGAVAEVAPAMAAYAERFIEKDLWNRPELSRRDRSLVTIAALISRNDTAELPHYLNVALDSGVKPAEISEVITHLAFYAGWPNATSAALVARNVFAHRHIDTASLPWIKWISCLWIKRRKTNVPRWLSQTLARYHRGS